MNRAELPFTRAEIEARLADCVDMRPAAASPTLDEVAGALAALGVRPGEIALIRAGNSMAMLTLFFGVLLAGAVPAPVSPATPGPRLRELARRFGAAVLLTEGRGGPRARPVGGDATAVELAPPARRRLSPGEVVLLTSGTSGTASGCRHGIGALVRNGLRHAAAVGLVPRDTVLVNLPMHFSYALVAQALAGFAVGARLLLDGPPFTAVGYAHTLVEHQVSSSSLTPYMVRELVRADWKPPESLRMLTIGGAALDPRSTHALLDRGPGTELYLTYGLTEAGPRVSTLAAHLEPAHRHGSVGTALPGVRLGLRDIGPDGVGEVLVSSDTVLRGRIGTVDDAGRGEFVGPAQIATGDLGRLDDAGRLFLRGRVTEFLTVRGTKVSLPSVRRVAEAIPGVWAAGTHRITDDTGEPGYRLDLHVTDTGPGTLRALRRELAGALLPAERPAELRLLPVEQLGHK